MYKLYYSAILIFIISVQSSLGQTHSRGMDFDDGAYQQAPKKAKLTRSLDILPSSASIKQYSPFPKTQDQYGTCAAWASAYCGRTMVDAIKNNWTDRAMITQNAYSPAFLFRLLRPDDPACNGGSNIETAFQLMKNKGSIPFTSLPSLCVPSIAPAQLAIASTAKLKDYARLFDVGATENIKVQAIKKAISEKKPVVIGIICPPSFDNAKNYWQPTEQPLQSYGGHALCVVGYDDSMYGGAFEIQNSWGIMWGNLGYIWIRYTDLAKYMSYAYEFIDLPDAKPDVPDLSGSLRLALSTGVDMPVTLHISTRGLKIVTADKPVSVEPTTPQPLTIYQTANTYTSGTNFRIYISNDAPAYVYAISSDLTNAVTKIFPYEDGISAALTYKKNDVAIPDEDHYIQFDNVAGKDFLCVLYSKNELNINELITKIATQTGTFNERVFGALGSRLVAPKSIKFDSSQIKFSGSSAVNQDVVALMVELDHK